MVTPNITRWDAKNLEGWTVTNPVDESRKIIDQIKGQVDVIVGVMHMDVENEYGVYGSGVTDLANACPEFDVIVAAHGHKSIPNQMINNVLVVEKERGRYRVGDPPLPAARPGRQVESEEPHLREPADQGLRAGPLSLPLCWPSTTPAPRKTP